MASERLSFTEANQAQAARTVLAERPDLSPYGRRPSAPLVAGVAPEKFSEAPDDGGAAFNAAMEERLAKLDLPDTPANRSRVAREVMERHPELAPRYGRPRGHLG
jgi:hypothetical protein